MEFEKRGWCRTYLLVDVEKLHDRAIQVEGYFTLSNRVFRIGECVSNSRRKKIFNGINSNSQYAHAILIGQLGKYIDESDGNHVYGDTSMQELLDYAFEIINLSSEKIPIRTVLLECREADESDPEEIRLGRSKLHQKYTDYGFIKLQSVDGLAQYIISLD